MKEETSEWLRRHHKLIGFALGGVVWVVTAVIAAILFTNYLKRPVHGASWVNATFLECQI
jgi:hypothetical protein